MKLQKIGIQRMWISLFFIFINELCLWLLKGGDLLRLSSLHFDTPWNPNLFTHGLNLQSYSLFLISCFSTVITMFFQFIILSNIANAIALFLGFQFTQNERLPFGLKMARSWSLLMYYLNHLAKTIFFTPAIKALKFIKNRRHRNMVAAVVAIYGFGISYLAFIPFGGLFQDGNLTNRFYYRMLYLILICMVAAFRIYGPTINNRKWHGRILHYLIPIFFILVMAMGVLSLSI
jgi:hypothetical protein